MTAQYISVIPRLDCGSWCQPPWCPSPTPRTHLNYWLWRSQLMLPLFSSYCVPEPLSFNQLSFCALTDCCQLWGYVLDILATFTSERRVSSKGNPALPFDICSRLLSWLLCKLYNCITVWEKCVRQLVYFDWIKLNFSKYKYFFNRYKTVHIIETIKCSVEIILLKK